MPRNSLRFGIASLLLLITCIAGYLAAYRFGTEEKWTLQQQKVTTREYPLSDLLNGNPSSIEQNLRQMQHMIESTTEGIWLGESLTIHPYPAKSSLVITQTGAGHDQIQKLLSDLRSHQSDVKKFVSDEYAR